MVLIIEPLWNACLRGNWLNQERYELRSAGPIGFASQHKLNVREILRWMQGKQTRLQRVILLLQEELQEKWMHKFTKLQHLLSEN